MLETEWFCGFNKESFYIVLVLTARSKCACESEWTTSVLFSLYIYVFVNKSPCQGKCRGSQCVVAAESDSTYTHVCVRESKCQPCGGGSCAFWLQREDRQMSRWRSGGGECGVWGIVGNARLLCPLRSTCLHTAHASNEHTAPLHTSNCVPFPVGVKHVCIVCLWFNSLSWIEEWHAPLKPCVSTKNSTRI